MDYLTHLTSLGQILLAFALGLTIGFEREYHHSPAGIRTYAAVCIGACLFGLISTHAQGADYYKSVAVIVSTLLPLFTM